MHSYDERSTLDFILFLFLRSYPGEDNWVTKNLLQMKKRYLQHILEIFEKWQISAQLFAVP